MSTSEKADQPTRSPSVTTADEQHGDASAEPRTNINGPPDGGTRAWLVAAGSSCVFFCCLGLANAFGVFQEYYMTHQLRHHSPDDIAWIGSLSAFIQFGSGAFGGPLFDRYGERMIWPFSVVYIFGLMMISLCTEYWQFMLSQGVVLGICTGFMQLPCLAALSQYFDKKKAAAFGIAIAGSSIGGVVFPLALSRMLNDLGLSFGWSVRIMAFICIPVLGFACVAIKSRLPPKKTSFFYFEAFRDKKFCLLILSLFFTFLGLFTPLFFLPAYAVSQGMDATLASYLLAIVNAASTFGRVIPGILADRWGRLNILAIGGVLSGVVIYCMNSASSDAGLIVFALAYGFVSGSAISGATAGLTICIIDEQRTGSYIGMGLALGSIAVLIGPPVNGVLMDYYGFMEVCIFSGTMMVVGGVTALATKALTEQGIFGRT
ncbi:hypothetical protein S7711_08762 [Stachybotrys chartarum IBT 7711]|uniref:Major facilitator superfamily (MFS) profile domain-containing protein n=1 Tax=Stachybotrys chartarum (strain CBS 109288 / IBT 7711) TaxID=1280523 RepID=A0A084AJQ1_STACB|nr:hypothetical protein S7711_08762 [Stachybotrys chartarum IBT 7711]KFA76617.1 hypothetical protein S40288_05960 [Stachybotrys chartarum IBT 40288]